MIYAALKSGKKCQIITLDFLRDHSFLLGPDYRDLFQLWQRNHHIQLGRVWWTGKKFTVQYLVRNFFRSYCLESFKADMNSLPKKT